MAGPSAANGLSRDDVVINIGALMVLNITGLFTALIDVARWPIAGEWKRHKKPPQRLLPTEAYTPFGAYCSSALARGVSAAAAYGHLKPHRANERISNYEGEPL